MNLKAHHLPLHQVPRDLPELKLGEELLKRSGHLKLFVDRAVTGSGYTVVIAYEPPGLLYQRRFGRRVIAPGCFLGGLLLALAAPLVDRRRKGGDGSGGGGGELAVGRAGPLYWGSLAAAVVAFLVGIYKRWLSGYSRDFPSRLKKARREISLSIAQGGAAVNRAVARHLTAAGGRATPLTDVLTPAEWGELFVAYVSRAERIDDGSSIANLSEAFRAGAISAARNMAYLAAGAQSHSIARALAKSEEELARQLEEEVAPFQQRKEVAVERAREEYANSTSAVALEEARQRHKEDVERLRRETAARKEEEAREHANRSRYMPEEEARKLHQHALESLDRIHATEEKNLDLRLRWSLEKYAPGERQAASKRASDVEEATALFDADTYSFYSDYQDRLRSARDSASRLQQDISRQLVDKEKPKCDSDDSRNRFAPPAYSIHSSVNVSSHRCVRDFLATFSAHHNSAEPVSKSTIVDSIRVSLSLD